MVDTANNNAVVKTGVSGAKLSKTGSSPRANTQVSRMNKNSGEPNQYRVDIVHQEPAGPNARYNILEWEETNASLHRDTLNKLFHKRS
ncbi:MAG: hypothetical protein ACFCU1_14095 [Sumerlaeia bacterium]